MLFRSFAFEEVEAIHEQIVLSQKTNPSTLVFVFCISSQSERVQNFEAQLRFKYSDIGVCVIPGGPVTCNGNILEKEKITVTVFSGSFRFRICFLDQEIPDDIIPESLSGIFLFGFGTIHTEADLRKCELGNTAVPVVGSVFHGQESVGIFGGEVVMNRSVAIFFTGDIIFQTKAFSDVIPIGNSFKIGQVEGSTTLGLRNITALTHMNMALGESYVPQVLQKKTIEFPLIVNRNGMFAPRSMLSVDFTAQSITWSGSVIDGEEAYLGMLSSEQVQESSNFAITFLNTTCHDGGFIFSDQARYVMLGDALSWNIQPEIRTGIIGTFGNSVFAPFHGTNESLSHTLMVVLFSDSTSTSCPRYQMRDIHDTYVESPVLNSYSILREVLQKQLTQHSKENDSLKAEVLDAKKRVDFLKSKGKEDLMKIIDNAPIAIWMGDSNEETTYANSRFEDLVGYSLDEMMGRKSFEFWTKESIETVQNNNENRLHGEKSTYEGDLLAKNHDIVPVRLTGIPISTGTVGMMLDLRELRKEELERAALQRLSDSKDSFLNIASHELRTPITSILGYISMLVDGDYGVLPQPAVNALTIIQSSGKRLSNIINHMLQLAKLESGRMVLQEIPISLHEIAQSIISEVHAIALERNIALEFDESEIQGTPMIIGDPDQIRKAILNLVGNSLKFTPGGGKVTLKIKRQGSELVLSVLDTGVGIPEKDHHKVFEKFGQSENPLSRTYEGTGLGLAFVKEVITQMNGRIELQSEVGKGSCFSIIFTKLG